jgi:hypothetical protein
MRTSRAVWPLVRLFRYQAVRLGLVDFYVRGLIPTGYSLNKTGGGSAATPSSTNGP